MPVAVMSVSAMAVVCVVVLGVCSLKFGFVLTEARTGKMYAA